MKRQFLLFTLVIIAVPLVTFANRSSMFRWHDHVRPPISLERALEISREQLGDDYENRYCVEVALYGNPYAQPKPGAWNLFFAAEDGSKKHVYINMDGDAEVKMWNHAIDWEKNKGLRSDLADIRTRFEEFLEKEELDASITHTDEKTVVSFHARSFYVHEPTDDGSYEAHYSQTVGPDSDGFIVEFWLTDTPTTLAYKQRPYWTERTGTRPLTTKNSFVHFVMRSGVNLKREYDSQIAQIFGTPDAR